MVICLLLKNIFLKGEDIGWVGKITAVDTDLIETLLMNGYTPIISTIGLDENIMLIILTLMMWQLLLLVL